MDRALLLVTRVYELGCTFGRFADMQAPLPDLLEDSSLSSPANQLPGMAAVAPYSVQQQSQRILALLHVLQNHVSCSKASQWPPMESGIGIKMGLKMIQLTAKLKSSLHALATLKTATHDSFDNGFS